MTQSEFKAQCAEAIKKFHDPVQDGPILTNVRMQTGPAAILGEWPEYPEYAAVIGHWPAQAPFGDYGQFMIEPNDCIVDLVRMAQKLAQARKPEPEPRTTEQIALDKLLD